MTDAIDRDDVRAFLEVGPGMRGKLERALDALMDLLDGLEDPDLEETGDEEPDADTEPSLGSPNESWSQERWGEGTPAMAWEADREGPEDDLEPSLAAPERHPIVPDPIYHRHGEHTSHDPQDSQVHWADGKSALDECEVEDEHGGDINDEPQGGDILDEPHDGNGDDEWSLGWAANISQRALGENTDDGDETAPERHGGGFVWGKPDDFEDDDREHDHAEWGVADQDALSIELAEGGGHVDDGDQSIPLFVGESVTEEARRMESLIRRPLDHVVRIRQAGDPQPEPLPGVIDVIGPGDAGEFLRLTRL